ncbi:MAG: YkgJ family cysteine cluster protein [Lachnospiraceae bacterium]|nr:YkgJ family cysteine cluster protein [Lachnospiraceae bacterium]
MIREINRKMISDDKLFGAEDFAPIGCGDCDGCGECCRVRGLGLTLDPFDVRLLKKAFKMSFQQLINAGMIELVPVDDIVLPMTGKKEGSEECVFLGADGRCSIHKIRPGICRMFPLARLYHKDGSFSYFVMEGECPYTDGTPVKISEWIGFKDIERYESEVRSYHDRLTALRRACKETEDEEQLIHLKRQFLIDNFVKD